MQTVKMINTSRFEVTLMKDADDMYHIIHGHVHGPLEVHVDPMSDLRMANILFNLKVEEYENRLH